VLFSIFSISLHSIYYRTCCHIKWWVLCIVMLCCCWCWCCCWCCWCCCCCCWCWCCCCAHRWVTKSLESMYNVHLICTFVPMTDIRHISGNLTWLQSVGKLYYLCLSSILSYVAAVSVKSIWDVPNWYLCTRHCYTVYNIHHSILWGICSGLLKGLNITDTE